MTSSRAQADREDDSPQKSYPRLKTLSKKVTTETGFSPTNSQNRGGVANEESEGQATKAPQALHPQMQVGVGWTERLQPPRKKKLRAPIL